MSITRRQARAHLEPFPMVDPSGVSTLDACLLSAECFQLVSPAGSIVFALEIEPPSAWVSVAAGRCAFPSLPSLNSAVLQIARQRRCTVAGFRTARRGLVRALAPLGWTVTQALPGGWQLERPVPDAHA